MKNLQEQYNLIKEGKGDKNYFLKSARHLCPQYINQYTNYTDAVKILKSRSILNESIGGFINHKPSSSWIEIFQENMSIETEVLDTPLDDLSFGSTVKVGDSAMMGNDKVTITLVDKVDGKIKQIKGETEDGRMLFVTKPMLVRPVKEENLSEAIGVKNKKEYGDQNEFEKIDADVQKALDNQYDTKNKKDIDNVYGTSFLNGYYSELKDPKNKDKSVDELKKIVLKNMTKDVNYYAKNGMFGTKGVGFETTKETIAPKGKYKSSGYGDLDKKKK
jgi:hypothetical protein